MRSLLTIMLAGVCGLAAAASVHAADIGRAVVGGGGGTVVAATRALRATVGQPVTGAAAGTTVRLAHGYWAPASDPLTSVPDPAAPPAVLRLHPNHPNPFNPRTTIAFDLPRAESRVRLRIHDLQGRVVATLVAGALPSGRFRFVWDGTDDAGREVAAGVYVSRLETTQDTALGKLTLVR